MESAARDLRRERRGARRAHMKAYHALRRAYPFRRRGDARRSGRAVSTAATHAGAVRDCSRECEALRFVAQARFIADGPKKFAAAAAASDRHRPARPVRRPAARRACALDDPPGDGGRRGPASPGSEAARLGLALKLWGRFRRRCGRWACARANSDYGRRQERRSHSDSVTPMSEPANLSSTSHGPSGMFGIAQKRKAAQRVPDEHPGVADGQPWDEARIAAIRWRAGDGTAEALDAALARALQDRQPFAH